MANETPNLAEMRRLMEQEAVISDAESETPVVGGMDWARRAAEPAQATAPTTPVTPEPQMTKPYDGPGLVISADSQKEPERDPAYAGINQNTQNNIEAYLSAFDEAIEKSQAETRELEAQHKIANNAPINEAQNTTPEDDFDKAYGEAVVVIDKIGVGRVLDFTDEEHAKLERAKTIKLNEVETVSLNTYNIKKLKDPKNFKNIIKNVNTLHTTPICLPLSGYTANIRGCTAYELMGLVTGGENALLDTQTKWSLIHSKIESTSIGDMDFNEFLFNTAAGDYNNFIYGILCATYPDDDKIPMPCKCGAKHEHSYSVRGLLRAERMSDELQNEFAKIVDASVSRETAMAVHDAAPITRVKGVKLPISGIVVELQVQSAYDLINNSLTSFSEIEDDDKKYQTATIIATLIKRALVPDPENPEEMYEFTDSLDIAKIVYELRERDILIITKLQQQMVGDLTIEYGFMKIKCPKCGKFREYMEIEPEQLLFQRCRQEFSANIE